MYAATRSINRLTEFSSEAQASIRSRPVLFLAMMRQPAVPPAYIGLRRHLRTDDTADMEQNPNKLFRREFETIDSVNGSTALLDCHMSKSLSPDILPFLLPSLSVSQQQIFRISWLKMPRQLLTRGRMKITTNQRINFVPHTTTDEDTFQLKIDPVLQEDAGEYRCVYKEDDAFHFKIAILNVNGELACLSLFR
ncbi:unnamed protein product [Dibothriocephalus latus]|uniref:Ig-like domain-containing protein n=1 Tax=Dibothriocephalus latus TaxID=60516 RepID=A0A3P6UC83_DIBLA|nr:unnamed protein product [Dibothriocephalus latus]